MDQQPGGGREPGAVESSDGEPDSGSAALVVLAAYFACVAALLLYTGGRGPHSLEEWVVVGHVPMAVMAAGAVLVARCRPGLVRAGRPGAAGVGLAVAGVLLGAGGGLAVGATSPERLAPLLSGSAQWVWALLWVGLAAPLVEELYFRGVLQAALAPRMTLPGAVAAAAAAFTVGHLGAVPLPLWFLLGLGFGALAAVSRSLWPAVAAHVGWNLATLLLSANPALGLAKLPLAIAGSALLAGTLAAQGRRGGQR